jgi:hypothetical protein
LEYNRRYGGVVIKNKNRNLDSCKTSLMYGENLEFGIVTVNGAAGLLNTFIYTAHQIHLMLYNLNLYIPKYPAVSGHFFDDFKAVRRREFIDCFEF